MCFAFCFTYVPNLLQSLTLYSVHSAAANYFHFNYLPGYCINIRDLFITGDRYIAKGPE